MGSAQISDSENATAHPRKRNRWGNPVFWVLGIAGAIQLFTSAGAIYSIRTFSQLARDRADEIKLISRVETALSLTKDIETACRGFILTGKEEYLDPYHAAAPRLNGLLQVLKEDSARGELLPQGWAEVENLLQERSNNCEQSLDLFARSPDEHAMQMSLSDQGKSIMDTLRNKFQQIIDGETSELQDLEKQTRAKEVDSLGMIVGGATISAVVFLSTALILLFQMKRRSKAEGEVEAANTRLQGLVETLHSRNGLINRLGEMSQALQSSVTFTEALQVLGDSMPAVFENTRGALFLTRESRDHLETGTSWGEGFQVPTIIGPTDCWGLRKGKIHQTRPGDKSFRCPHIMGEMHGASLCVPLLAQGDTRGVLHVEFPGRTEISHDEEESAGACAEQVIVALANLQLRDRLRTQATRDPLSGLFNRRYVMETAEREVFRACRHGDTPVSFILIDIDHFKRFNDTHGHDAGDYVIQVLANHLRKCVRNSDIAARYGGEEFLIVLPDAQKEAAALRARELGAQVRQVPLSHHGVVIGNITLSMGVASFPEDGTTIDEILKIADLALYEAKASGRDRVIVGGTTNPKTGPGPATQA